MAIPPPSDDEVLNFLLNGRRPKYRKDRPASGPKSDPGRLAALFAEHFDIYGGGYAPYGRGAANSMAKRWATRWAEEFLSDVDAREFLRLGGRPQDLRILVEWDRRGMARKLLGARLDHRNRGRTTIIQELQSRRMSIDAAVRLLSASA